MKLSEVETTYRESLDRQAQAEGERLERMRQARHDTYNELLTLVDEDLTEMGIELADSELAQMWLHPHYNSADGWMKIDGSERWIPRQYVLAYLTLPEHTPVCREYVRVPRTDDFESVPGWIVECADEEERRPSMHFADNDDLGAALAAAAEEYVEREQKRDMKEHQREFLDRQKAQEREQEHKAHDIAAYLAETIRGDAVLEHMALLMVHIVSERDAMAAELAELT